MKNYEGVQSKLYEVIVETKELHRLESSGDTEQEAIGKALDLLDLDVSLSNRNISYSVMDIVLKDEYVWRHNVNTFNNVK